jgi:hypothetical protein
MGVRAEDGVPTVGMIVGLGEAVAVGFSVGVNTGVGEAVATTAVAGVVGLGSGVGVGVGLAWATRLNVLDTVTSIARAMVITTRKPTTIMTRPALILACSRMK